MKRANLIASIFAAILGLISIYLGVKTSAGWLVVISLAVIYAIGSSYVFYLATPVSERREIADVKTTYGRSYWIPLISGILVSILLAALFFVKFDAKLVSTVLVGQGLMSLLTAFVSPKLHEKLRIEDAEEFG